MANRVEPGTKRQARLPRWQVVTILLLPFLLYINVLTGDHGFALDDAIVISENQFTKQGIAGIPKIFGNETFTGFFGEQKDLVAGSRYRPLSVASFAVEVELFGMNAWPMHFFNIVYYALTGLVLLYVLWHLLGPRFPQWRPILPWLAAMLFLLHPLHTEVVANIKGRDEIFALLFSLLALFGVVKGLTPALSKGEGVASSNIWLFIAPISFFLALLSKENAFTFVAVVPIALYIFTKVPLPKIALGTAALLLPAIAAYLIRADVVGGMSVGKEVTELMNNPFVGATAEQKWATIIYTMGKYVELLFFPFKLSHDYYPYQIPLVTIGNGYVLGSLVLYLGITAGAIYGMVKRTLPGFALAFYLITFSLVSNIVFPIGTFMAERLIYMPSVGWALLVGWAMLKLPQWIKVGTILPASAKWKPVQQYCVRAWPVGLMLVVIAVGFGYRTLARNPVWQSNSTLFLGDIEVAPNSAKLNNAAGGVLYDMSQEPGLPEATQRDYLVRSKQYLLRAVQIYPGYGPAYKTLGNVYFYLDRDYERAIAAYLTAGERSAYRNIYAIGQRAQEAGEWNNAALCFSRYVALEPTDEAGHVALAKSLMEAGRPDEALTAIHAGLEALPGSAELRVQKGLVYGRFKGDLGAGIRFFEEAITINPNHTSAYENLGVAYAMLGRPADAVRYFEQAIALNSNNPNTHQNIGLAYRQLGNEAKAEEHLRRAQELRGG